MPLPQEQTPPPPGADTPLPQEQTPPGSRHPSREQTPLPGADTPPGADHAGRYGQHAGGTHPSGMQSCSEI